jgi:hypothetical protein
MFFDRVFALIAAAGFAFGAGDHVLWLGFGADAKATIDLKTASLLLSSTVLIYMVAYVGKRDGHAYDQKNELLLQPLMRTLPVWVGFVTYGLMVYAGGLLMLGLADLILESGRAAPLCAVREHISDFTSSTMACEPLDTVFTAMIVVFSSLSFAEMMYLIGIRRGA